MHWWSIGKDFVDNCLCPPRISYANVHNYYGPYTYCSLEKGVASAQHIQLPTHTCAGHLC